MSDTRPDYLVIRRDYTNLVGDAVDDYIKHMGLQLYDRDSLVKHVATYMRGVHEACESAQASRTPTLRQVLNYELGKHLPDKIIVELEAALRGWWGHAVEERLAGLEQERVRLAGVLTAIDGHEQDPSVKQGDYGWSPTYDAARRLRAELTEMQKCHALECEARNKAEAELAEAKKPLSVLQMVADMPSDTSDGDLVEEINRLVMRAKGPPVSDAEIERAVNRLCELAPVLLQARNDAYEVLRAIAGRPLAVEPVSEAALREAIVNAVPGAWCGDELPPHYGGRVRKLVDALRPLLSQSASATLARPVMPSREALFSVIKDTDLFYEDRHADEPKPWPVLWHDQSDAVREYLRAHCAEPSKPVSVSREVVREAVVDGFGYGEEAPLEKVAGITDAVMAALAEHTTPRPTREQIEDAVAAGHAAGWNKGGIDASDEVVDRIEALLDGKDGG